MSQYFSYFPTVNYDLFFDGQRSEVTDIFRIVKVKNTFKDDVTYYTFYDIQDGERPDVVSTKLYGTADYYWTFFMVNDRLVNLHTDWPLSTSDLEHAIDKKYAGDVLTSNEDISTVFNRGSVVQGLLSNARARILNKDPNLGIIKVEIISGRFTPNEIIRDIATNEFITITGQIKFKDAVHHFENSKGEYVNRNTVGATPITNSENEFVINDSKTQIKVLRPRYVQVIADQFIEQIRIS